MGQHDGYADPRYGVKQTLVIPDKGATQTSAIASAVVIKRYTFMHNVKVTDWNVAFVVGGTQTGAAAASNFVQIGKSLAGTGAVSVIGSAAIGTQANNTVKDATVTETTFKTGDDLVVQYAAGTGLAAGVFQAGANVQYVENYVHEDNQ